MKTYEVLNLFAAQLEKAVNEKIVITPSSINEKGVVIKVSLLKTFLATPPQGACGTRTSRIRVSVCGTAESLEGLSLAVDAVEKLDKYLLSQAEGKRLLSADGKIIPNTRIVTVVSEEDSFIDSPDSVAVQDVQDDRICLISFPCEQD
jgi:hypothetical protein